jgi:hypothetical protein
MPLKSVGTHPCWWPTSARPKIRGALQYNIVRIDGQRSVYMPVFKQGGNSNTITIVDGMKAAIKHLVDIPQSLKTAVVFDQSVFVKLAIGNVTREAGIGLVLTGSNDPDLSWQPARHDCRAAFGSAVDGVSACWSPITWAAQSTP